MMSSYLKAAAFLLLLSFAACWADSRDPMTSPPTVLSNSPLDGANGVPLNESVSATFSRAMDPATLTAATFTLTSGAAAVPVHGTVIYANPTVVFWPAVHLASRATFTATITTGARSAASVPLAENHVWSITTGDTIESRDGQ
jgi:hypothetical protein